jgi:hypothetical protein
MAITWRTECGRNWERPPLECVRLVAARRLDTHFFGARAPGIRGKQKVGVSDFHSRVAYPNAWWLLNCVVLPIHAPEIYGEQ